MQLISREKLLEDFFNDTPQGCGQVGIKYVDDLINSQPVAFDVDKLIKDILVEFNEIEQCCHDGVKDILSIYTTLIIKKIRNHYNFAVGNNDGCVVEK